MWFDAPAWSSAPHFEGHHFSSLSFGGVAALADEIGDSENLPCSAPATAPTPANPAAFRNPRRSVDADALSTDSSLLLSVMLPSPGYRSLKVPQFQPNHDSIDVGWVQEDSFVRSAAALQMNGDRGGWRLCRS